MTIAGNPEHSRLLAAKSESERDQAWTGFVDRYSPLLLHTIGSVLRGHDRRMDGFAFVLEQLRRDDCDRLRRYTNDGRAEFTTWLVIVTRRLCIDFLRSRYGRDGGGRETPDRAIRRSLESMTGTDLDGVENYPDQAPNPLAALVEADQAARIEDATAQLGESDRLVLVLRYQDARSAHQDS